MAGEWSYKVDGTEVNDKVNQFAQIPELSNRVNYDLITQDVDGDFPAPVRMQPRGSRLTFLIAMRNLGEADFDARVRALDRLFSPGAHVLTAQARGMVVERAMNFYCETTNVDYRQRLYTASCVAPRSVWTGERMESFETVTRWTAGSAVAITRDAGDMMVGTSSGLFTVTALGNGSTSTSFAAHDTDLTNYVSYGRGLRVWVKASTLANLGSVRIVVYGPTTSDSYSYTVTPTLANTWQEKEVLLTAPAVTAGTPNLEYVVRVGVAITATGGSYSGTIRVDNLRIGSI